MYKHKTRFCKHAAMARVTVVTIAFIFAVIAVGISTGAGLAAFLIVAALMLTPFRYTELEKYIQTTRITNRGLLIVIVASALVGVIAASIISSPTTQYVVSAIGGAEYFVWLIVAALTIGFFVGQTVETLYASGWSLKATLEAVSPTRCAYITIATSTAIFVGGGAFFFL